MKAKQYFTALAMSLLSSATFAQSGITTDVNAPYDDVTYLIQNILSDGSAQVSNITYTYGDAGQIGYFSDANTATPVFGYDEGVFMSTRGGAPIENDNGGVTFGPNPEIIDPDLAASLSLLFGTNYDPPTANYVDGGHDQNNVIIIEFDIVANLSYFEFYYTFASREYKDYVCSPSFNDVFGFYVTGPNPNDPANPYVGKNIALVPADPAQTSFTNYPVSINSINRGWPSNPNNLNYCLDANPNFESDTNFFVYNTVNNQPGPVDFNFYGYTKPLRAYVEAECHQTYHMKLAICDVWDSGWGSSVMLKKGSLRSPVDVTVEDAPNVYPDTNGWFYEGCGISSLTFKRPSLPDFAPGTGDLYVGFTLAGAATYGVDYEFTNSIWNDHIIIPNMENEFTLEIDPVEDFTPETPEDIIFQIPHLLGESCDDGYIETKLTIVDHPELVVELVDEMEVHCPGDEVTFEVTVNGGLPITASDPYNIHWSLIGNAYQQTINPEVSTMYYVEVSDLCPQYTYTDSIYIDVAIWPELVIDELEDKYICTDVANKYEFLKDKVHGGDGIYTYSWVDVETGNEISTEEDPLLFAGEYEITIRDGCENQAKEQVTIYLYELPDADILVEEQSTERLIQFSINEFPINSNYSFMPIDYTWDFGDGSPLVVNKGPLLHQYEEFGFYTVTLRMTNDKGCEKVFTKLIEIAPFINVPTIFTPNGDGLNEGFCAVTSRQYESYEMHVYDR